MNRTIIHCDINHCFAQIEEMKNPQLRKIPMCVGGNEDLRNGIILARNLQAKKYGVKSAETLRDAYRKCPNLKVLKPSYSDYMYYSKKVKDIYYEYTDDVESFGIDEAWMDVTNSKLLYGDGITIGKIIQKRVYEELGLTISVGISFNKVFAKLGSDLVKPSGFTVITEENYKEMIWDLPVDNLLYVGRQTTPKLYEMGIFTIGDLALYDIKRLNNRLGKQGQLIWNFANGHDSSPVQSQENLPKSVGNGITPPKNIDSLNELKNIMYVLVESVAARLKEQNLEGSVISVSLRTTSLKTTSHQKKIEHPTNLVCEIMQTAMDIVMYKFDFCPPYRSVTVTIQQLNEAKDFYQTNIFDDGIKREKNRKLEESIEEIRSKYGFETIKRATILEDRTVTEFNPKGTHIIHPVGFFK